MSRSVMIFRRFLRPTAPGRFLSSKGEAKEPDESEPIKFSSSPAAKRTVMPIMSRLKHEMPWYQPYSVVASVTVFLIYFCYLREENDMDIEFTKTLYDRIQGLEKEQLLQAYRFNMEQGKSVVEIEQRLKELEAQEANDGALE